MMKKYNDGVEVLGAGFDAGMISPIFSMFSSGGDKSKDDEAKKKAEAAAAKARAEAAAAKRRQNWIIGLSLGTVGVVALGVTGWAVFRKRK